jgi:hypothetical protein
MLDVLVWVTLIRFGLNGRIGFNCSLSTIIFELFLLLSSSEFVERNDDTDSRWFPDNDVDVCFDDENKSCLDLLLFDLLDAVDNKSLSIMHKYESIVKKLAYKDSINENN